MPIGDGITVPLGWPGLAVLGQEAAAGGGLVVVVPYARRVVACPRGGRATAKVHDRRAQHARALPPRRAGGGAGAPGATALPLPVGPGPPSVGAAAPVGRQRAA